MAMLGPKLDDIRTAVGNANQEKWSLDGPLRASTIGANDQLRSIEEYRNPIIAYKNGEPVISTF